MIQTTNVRSLLIALLLISDQKKKRLKKILSLDDLVTLGSERVKVVAQLQADISGANVTFSQAGKTIEVMTAPNCRKPWAEFLEPAMDNFNHVQELQTVASAGARHKKNCACMDSCYSIPSWIFCSNETRERSSKTRLT